MHYVDGDGDAVLLLPGRVGIGSNWRDLVAALRPRYRTITLDYPPTTTTFAELADHVLGILDREGVDRTHVVGQSAGGMLAEILTRRAPERVRSLAFSGTGLYGPEDVEWLTARLAEIRTTPWERIVESSRAAMERGWRGAPAAAFWIDQVEEHIRRGGPDGFANSYAMLVDLARTSGELEPGWEGPVLVLTAEDDPVITSAHRERLLALHPDAELRVFPEGGHSLLLTKPTEYTSAIMEFLG